MKLPTTKNLFAALPWLREIPGLSFLPDFVATVCIHTSGDVTELATLIQRHTRHGIVGDGPFQGLQLVAVAVKHIR